jgi:WD40 repeat protein
MVQNSLVYRVFVSHSSRDTASAVAVTWWLMENEPSLDGEIFLDVDSQTGIAPGTRWKSELVRAVDCCEAVICLISPAWDKSPECQAEFRHAESLNKRIFCARLDRRAQGMKAREWQFCDLFPDGQPQTTAVESESGGEPIVFATDGLQRLLRGLREAGIGAEHFPWPPEGDPKRAPYRGWQSMQDADAAVFFGRDAQILRGLDALRGMRATGVEGMFVILGPSGVGKSSFLRAGLLPRLRRDHKNFLVCDIVRPERAAVTGDHGLAHAIWQLRSRAGPSGPALGDVKAACLTTDTGRVTTWLREAQRHAVGEDGAAPTLVLPIDQGEELFSADAGPEATTCLTLLGSLLQAGAMGELPLIAATTIRADRYESLQNAPELLGVHTREFGDLKPMPVTEYKDVITGPARRATAAGLRLNLDAALVARLLADATGGADSLPLLALTLSRLYLDYGSTGRLTLANYEAMGGMARIVEAEIDTLLATDPDQRAQQLDTLRSAFIPWLATIDPDTDAPTRRVASWSELPRASHELIDAMVARRLLVKDDRGGETVVEVALESLLRQWDSLAGWLRDQAAGLKLADNLDRGAADWERNERSPEWLIEGVRLAAAEQLADSPVFADRVSHAADFLRASREREDAQAEAERRRQEAEQRAELQRKRVRVMRAVLALTLVVTLVALTGFLLAVLARQEAGAQRDRAVARGREALAERLTSQAQGMLVGGLPGSELEAMFKAIAAQHISAKPDIGAQLTALTTKPRLQEIIDLPRGGLLSADGERIAAATDAGVRLLDIYTGQPVGPPFADPRTEHIVALSADGRYAAIASWDNIIRIWDSATGRPIGQPMTGSEQAIRSAAVSPDGRRVAAQDFNDTLRLWDAETGRQIGGPLKGHDRMVTALAFSPDGRRLASAGGFDNTVRLWDASNAAGLGEPLRGGDPRLGGHDAVWSVAFSPDGHTIAAGGSTMAYGKLVSAGTPLRLWNADTGAAIGNPVIGDYGKSIDAVAFSLDGAKVATGGSDKTVRVWDAHTGLPIGPPLTFQAPVRHVAFTPPGRHIVAVSGDTVQVSDVDPNAALVRESEGSKLHGLAQGEATFALSTRPDNPRIAVVRADTLQWLDPDTGQVLGQIVSDALRGITQFDLSPNISPSNRWLALAGPDNDTRVVNASTGRLYPAPMKGNGDVVRTVAFSPDGYTLATGSDDMTVRLWDWRSGRQIGEPMRGHESGVHQIGFSPDGRRLYSRSAESIRIWDTTTTHAVGNAIRGTANVFSDMAISPDGRRFAAASAREVQQWDAQSGAAVGPPLTGHNEDVEGITYSPDGRYLVSIAADNTLRFWDTSSGGQIGRPVDTSAVGQTVNVDFSHDGRRVFVAAQRMSLDGMPPFVGGGIWELPGPAAWTDALCGKLTSNPGQQRWKEWISPDIPYVGLCPGKPVVP